MRYTPAYWSFPGGKIELRETEPAAAIREMYEETGVVVAATQLIHREPERIDGEEYRPHVFMCHITEARMDTYRPETMENGYKLFAQPFPTEEAATLVDLSERYRPFIRRFAPR
jgi:8-oxo-dGTP pyrophosphatase MutT (NUDIX family)